MKLLQQKISELIAKLLVVRTATEQEGKPFTVADAWNLFQTAVGEIVKIIEMVMSDTSGADKKELALEALGLFYDRVIVSIDIPYVPNLFEPIVDKLIKRLFMYLAKGVINSTVTLLNNLGVFKKD